MISRFEIIKTINNHYCDVINKWERRLEDETLRKQIKLLDGIDLALEFKRIMVEIEFANKLGITEEEIGISLEELSNLSSAMMIKINRAAYQ